MINISSYDLEVQTLSVEGNAVQQLQVRPTVTFPISRRVDLTTGLIYRINDGLAPNQYGVYFKFTFKPKRDPK